MRKKIFLSLFFIQFALSLFSQIDTILSFNHTNGALPQNGGLATDGTYLYGMTMRGGINDNGVAFKLKPDGTQFTNINYFTPATGTQPQGSIMCDSTHLYGMTFSGGTVFKMNLDGSAYTTLVNFNGTNGSSPSGEGTLISDSAYLYGMTYSGGISNKGVVFKLKKNGAAYTKLYDFAGADGQNPCGSLVSDGTWLYGMTARGGLNDSGEVFKIKKDGTGFTTLLDFNGTNGALPFGSLIFDGTYLYGMTNTGGANHIGLIFKIKTDGTGFQNILDFNDTNGKWPMGSLVSDGTYLYGMTFNGGTYGVGLAFKIKTDGTNYSSFGSFNGYDNGEEPQGTLMLSNHVLYGMVSGGGPGNLGVIIKICAFYPTLTASKTSICLGDSVTLTAATASSYTWAANSINPNDSVITVKPNTTTTYTIAGSKGACSGVQTITINVFNPPTIAVNNAVLCTGQTTATLTAAGANTYTWSTSDTTASITVSPTLTTTYTLTATDTNHCTQTTYPIVSIHATILAPVLAGATQNPASICQGQTIQVLADTGATAVWFQNGNKIFIGNSFTAPDSLIGTKVYTVIDSSLGSGCSSSATGGVLTVTLTLNQSPVAPHFTDSNLVYCQNKPTLPIHASGVDSILWSTTPNFSSVISIGSNYTPPNNLPLGVTTYYIKDSSFVNGCKSVNTASVSVTITPDSLPSINLYLLPDSIPHVWDLYVDYSSSVVNARWYWGDGTDTLALFPYHYYDSAGVYNICATVYNACGDSSSSCQADSIYRNSSTLSNPVLVNVKQAPQITGILNVANSFQYQVYPNPSNGSFTISSPQKIDAITVSNLLGQTLAQINPNAQSAQLNITAAGVYFVHITVGNKTATQKLIITN